MKKIIFRCILLVSVLFYGCGRGSSGGASSFTESNNNPNFLSDDKISVPINHIDTFSFKVVAKDASNIKYYITGKDAKNFFIDVMTGELTFRNITDIEPMRIYELTVIAEDGVSHREMQSLSITILEKVEEENITEEIKEEDTTAPLFSSATKYISINEGDIEVFRAIATDENEVSYSISGGNDASSFIVNSETGVVSFISQSNYIKSSYIFNIVAMDSYGNTSVQVVNVTIIKTKRWTSPSKSVCVANDGKWKRYHEQYGCLVKWENANKICDIIGGILPNIDVLRDIVTDCGGDMVIGDGGYEEQERIDKNIANESYQACTQNKGFILNDYWSSTTNESNSSYAWGVTFDNGNDYLNDKTHLHSVQCDIN